MSYRFGLAPFVILGVCALAGCAAEAPDGGAEPTSTAGAALGEAKAFVLDEAASSDVVFRLTTAHVARHVLRPLLPNIETLLVDISCEISDRCTANDREGDPAAAPAFVTAEAGAHLSGDLLRSGAPGEPSLGRVSELRVVCETDNGAHARCVAATPVLIPAGPVLITGVSGLVAWTASSQQTDSGSSFTNTKSYELTYVDAGSYFGETPRVWTTVVQTTRVAHHGGLPDAPQTTSSESPLEKVGPRAYKGRFAISLAGGFGDWQTNLVHLGVAFSASGKWDSSFGSNYDL